jgi:hypothetical protein
VVMNQKTVQWMSKALRMSKLFLTDYLCRTISEEISMSNDTESDHEDEPPDDVI